METTTTWWTNYLWKARQAALIGAESQYHASIFPLSHGRVYNLLVYKKRFSSTTPTSIVVDVDSSDRSLSAQQPIQRNSKGSSSRYVLSCNEHNSWLGPISTARLTKHSLAII